jgi:hypothetical protein
MTTAVKALLVALLLAGVIGCTEAEVIEGKAAAALKPVFRVNCGAGKEYTDKKGCAWLGDQVLSEKVKWGAVDGLTIERKPMEIAGSDAPQLYLTERYSMKGYEFSLPNGKYTLRLHFAETYERHSKAGERLFSVKVQGEVVLKDLDVLKEAGGFAKPLIKECKGVAVTDGKLKIEFVANVQNPEINAIEVLR